MERSQRFAVHKSKYFYLLLILLLFFIGTSILTDMKFRNAPIHEYFSVVILFCIYIVSRERTLIYYTGTLGFLLIAGHLIIQLLNVNISVYVIFYLANIFFLTLFTYSILYSISSSKEISADILFGAVCGYIMLGIVWSYIFALIETLSPGSFHPAIISDVLLGNDQNSFYYSFTTLTTLGYGDILPISNIARACSWLEAVTGQIYLAIWIALLVGLRIAQEKS